MSANARQLTFYNGETPVENGASITFNDVQVTPAGANKEVMIAPELSLGTDTYSSQISLVCKSDGESVQMCAGGACEQGKTIKKTLKINGGKTVPLQFEYMATLPKDAAVPKIVCTFEAQDGTYADTKITMTVVLNGENGGIEAIVNGYELYSDAEGVHYNVEGARQLALYGITGMKVLQRTVSGSGVIATGEIPAGIYVYTLGNKSGKIIVR